MKMRHGLDGELDEARRPTAKRTKRAVIVAATSLLLAGTVAAPAASSAAPSQGKMRHDCCVW